MAAPFAEKSAKVKESVAWAALFVGNGDQLAERIDPAFRPRARLQFVALDAQHPILGPLDVEAGIEILGLAGLFEPRADDPARASPRFDRRHR